MLVAALCHNGVRGRSRCPHCALLHSPFTIVTSLAPGRCWNPTKSRHSNRPNPCWRVISVAISTTYVLSSRTNKASQGSDPACHAAFRQWQRWSARREWSFCLERTSSGYVTRCCLRQWEVARFHEARAWSPFWAGEAKPDVASQPLIPARSCSLGYFVRRFDDSTIDRSTSSEHRHYSCQQKETLACGIRYFAPSTCLSIT